MKLEKCPWCGIETPESDGLVHQYLDGTPGCWAHYGKLLAREYENHDYMVVHGLTVDAYALQHPGEKSPKTTRSAYIHSASLFSYFKLKRSMSELASIKQAVAARTLSDEWLIPPTELNTINVGDVLAAKTAQQHRQSVEEWARYIFECWALHHEKIIHLIA
ncbi:MAG: DUF5946 family protein [Phormidesmis sp.]